MTGRRGWFAKGSRMTADTARRITGISGPFGGLQWADPGPSETKLVRQFVVFMEDRRVLYSAMDLEVLDQVERSLHEIREECTKTLQALPSAGFTVLPIRNIREAARRFHDDRNEDFRFFDHDWTDRAGSPGFFAALGAFRAIAAYQVALLAAHHDLEIEGELARVLPIVNERDE